MAEVAGVRCFHCQAVMPDDAEDEDWWGGDVPSEERCGTDEPMFCCPRTACREALVVLGTTPFNYDQGERPGWENADGDG